MAIDGNAHAPSRAWTVAWRCAYAVLGVLDPLLRIAWRAGALGITARLTVRGRRTGRRRSILVGLLRVGGAWYVGHPNGAAAWTRNLQGSGRATVEPSPGTALEVDASLLPRGPERLAVIRATRRQQPFPANLLYAAAQRHIRAVGTYFRIEPLR